MASSAAPCAVKEALVVAVCVVLLLHSSAGHQLPKPPRPPARPHCHSQGPSPSPSSLPPSPTPTTTPPPVPTPTPTPTPAPAPPPTLPPPPVPTTPTPSPAPAPVNCSARASDCASQCTPICQAQQSAGITKCESDYAASLNGCHDACTNYACPGGSCVPSGCYCPCGNANATSCCQSCGNGVYSTYASCERMYEKGFGYCMTNCGNTCYKNCTQGA